MKKETIIAILTFIVLIIIAALVYLVAGVKGDYKEGTYYGNDGTTTAVVYVDEDGMIKSVGLDVAYIQYADGECVNTKTSYDGSVQCIPTTKQILGDDYGMKDASDVSLEWYEQAESLSEKVVEEQGIEWLELDEDNYTDSISSVTIHANELKAAIADALAQAKK